MELRRALRTDEPNTAYFADGSAPDQPGELLASALFARSSAFTRAVPRSLSTNWCLMRRRRKSAHKNSRRMACCPLRNRTAGADQLAYKAPKGIVGKFR